MKLVAQGGIEPPFADWEPAELTTIRLRHSILAEGGGVEPPLPDPESGVLPLDDPSIFLHEHDINILQQILFWSSHFQVYCI